MHPIPTSTGIFKAGPASASRSTDPSQRDGIDDAERIDLFALPAADDPSDQARDQISESVRRAFDSLAERRWAEIAEALRDVAGAIDLLMEFGIEGNAELQDIVKAYLDDRDDLLGEMDQALALIDWSGDVPQHLRWMSAHVKMAISARAMPQAPEGSEEQSRWRREHRDIGLQLKWLSKPLTGVGTLGNAAALLPRMMSHKDPATGLRKDTADRRWEFGQHVESLLNDWSDDRLVCLRHNLNSLVQAWSRESPATSGAEFRTLERLGDAEVQAHLHIITVKLSVLIEKRGIDEPEPERRMLRVTDNIADLEVLAQWLLERRVSEDDVQAAFETWSSSSLKDVLRKYEHKNPWKYHTLVHHAEAMLSRRESDAAHAGPAAAREEPAGPARLRFVDGAGVHGPTPAGNAADQAAHFVGRYTSWGSRYSAGALVNTGLRWLTLSEPARRVGNWVQHGHATGALYAGGAVIKGLASITGAASGLVASAVSVVETLAVNVVGGCMRVAGAAALGLGALAAKIAGPVSPAADRTGDKMAGKAADLLRGISLVSRKPPQVPVPPHLIGRAENLARLARITGSTTAEVRDAPLPQGFSRANRGDIPVEILSREAGGTGRATKLHFDPSTGVLAGDRWSGLMVGVFVEEDAQGTGLAYHLSFVGTQAGRPATFKSDTAQSLLGLEDSAFLEADAIVKAFVARYGADKVKLQGHSLGGALAQWAGIRNSGGDSPVKVSCFNAAGLHVNMRNRLGEALIARSDVEHFNTGKDALSQVVEGARSPILGAQIGRRYVVPESGGHSLKHHIAGLAALPQKTAERRSLPLVLIQEAATIRDDRTMKLLGHGSVNQVFSAVATLPDGSLFQGVYKRDTETGVARASLRNLATSKLDQRLELGVIARTHLVVGPQGIGSIMEMAKGLPPVHLGHNSVEVSPDVAAHLRDDPSLLDEYARSNGFVGARIEGETVSLLNEHPLDPDDEAAGTEERVSYNRGAFATDSDLYREVTKLQWLDALTGQCDRHAGNYFVSRDLYGRIRVTGIDNDLSFAADLLDPESRPLHEAPRLPSLVDIKTALALLALTPADIEEDCTGLSSEEIEATKARLAIIQDRIRSFGPQSAAGRVLAEDADWTSDENEALLGVSALEEDLRKKGVGYMEQEASRTSYVARELAPYVAQSLGVPMPILNPRDLVAVARGRPTALSMAQEAA